MLKHLPFLLFALLTPLSTFADGDIVYKKHIPGQGLVETKRVSSNGKTIHKGTSSSKSSIDHNHWYCDLSPGLFFQTTNSFNVQLTNNGTVSVDQKWKTGYGLNIRVGGKQERLTGELEIAHYKNKLSSLKISSPGGSIAVNNLSSKNRGMLVVLNGFFDILQQTNNNLALGIGFGFLHNKATTSLIAGGTDTINENDKETRFAYQFLVHYDYTISDTWKILARYRLLSMQRKKISPSSSSNITTSYKEPRTYIQGIELGTRYLF